MIVKKTLILLIIIFVFASFLMLRSVLNPSIDQISSKMGIEVPPNAEILFFKEISSLTTGVVYLKIRINRNDWSKFIDKEKFKRAHKGEKGYNVFSDLEITFENWKPQEVDKSLSGKFIVKEPYKRTVTYLFDIQKNLWVDCYFAIYQE